jgi:hypothetical protein
MDATSPKASPNPVDSRRGIVGREWTKEKAREMRAAMGLPADPRLEPRI